VVLIRPDPKGYTYFKTPRFPDVPQGEWKARVKKVQTLMADHSIDCLTLWGRENVRYFFGFQNTHWWIKSLQPAVGVIPTEGEPILVVPDFFLGAAEGLCWARDIRTQPNPHEPRSLRELPKEIAGVIKEIGCGDKAVALESGPLGCMYIPRPVNDIDALRNSLPNAKFVDGDRVIWGCRMVKSPLEADRIRTSVNGMQAVELSIVEGFRPGMTEVDLFKIINQTRANLSLCLGDDLMGSDELVAGIEKATFADVAALEGVACTKDFPIEWDGCYPYKGYTPDSARVWQVGPITSEIKKSYDTIFEAEDAAESMLKPRVKAKDVYEAMYSVLRSAGYKSFDMGGHGTGLDCHEPPSIDAWNEQTIEEGMTLSIEPWLVDKKGAMFGIQDTFLVTDKACEKIEALRRDIIQVSHPIL
jgi:Xaa-Pro aminopeptidase